MTIWFLLFARECSGTDNILFTQSLSDRPFSVGPVWVFFAPEPGEASGWLGEELWCLLDLTQVMRSETEGGLGIPYGSLRDTAATPTQHPRAGGTLGLQTAQGRSQLSTVGPKVGISCHILGALGKVVGAMVKTPYIYIHTYIHIYIYTYIYIHIYICSIVDLY